jgi:predicted dehydrogenase
VRAQNSPNETVRIAVVGNGGRGASHMGAWTSLPNVELAALVDVDSNQSEKYIGRLSQQKKKIVPTFKDVRKVLEDKNVDAISIASPNHWHTLQTIWACQAGKDVYVEKPCSHNVFESKQIIAAARKYNRMVQMGSQSRSSVALKEGVQKMKDGEFGEIYMSRGLCYKKRNTIGKEGISQPPPSVDFDMWLGPAPTRGYHSKLSPRGVHKHFPGWRDYREYGGGMVTDWGAHHFDIAQWGLGMDESGPVEVIPPAAANAQNGARFRYANGVEMVHQDGNGVTFIGTEGRIYVNRGKFESTPESLVETPLEEQKIQLYVSNDHIGDWLGCIRTRKRRICDVEVGARTVTVCHLANLAYWTGQHLKWDPKKEEFTGGFGDNAWLDRPYREPWSLRKVLAA